MEIDVDEVRRIGKYNTDKTRPIISKLVRFTKKTEILKQGKILKEFR